ncbi:four-carbon acid sugar kinase family protein [Oryzifoliimicrobium ureilyticus]|uniref:four-carbon acid sugar kinase family protein n=1 Tax=Oryzifoliimicrobium ureilyticus TaxID=3113724 RepID=UPI0030765F0D
MLVILADDVTGTLDAAAPFAGRGLSTRVVMRIDAVADALRNHDVDVLSVNLNCREVSANEARGVMARAVSLLPPGATVFKKVDSRLKGNIAAELDAIDFPKALVAPAIPAFGRFVENGHLRGFGVDQPISVLAALGGAGDRCLVPDMQTDQDMREALARAQAEGVDLFIGARGLAEALAASMTGKAEARPVDIPSGTALFVIGSRDPITLAQVAALRHGLCVDYVEASNGIIEAPSRSERTIVVVQALSGASRASPEQVSTNLAAGVVPEMTRAARTWLLSGGATADAVLLRAGISELALLGECLPGLGVAEAHGHCIIAKSGGFGAPDTLARVAAKIMGAE